MRVVGNSITGLERGVVLLAPTQIRRAPMKNMIDDEGRHNRLLAAVQRLRGEIYLCDGAISSDSLTNDGRHIQQDDYRSWHILTVDEREEVSGCMRFCAHGPGVVFSDLAVSHSSASEMVEIGPKIQEAVQTDIEEASRLGFLYVELGGWAIHENLRCTTEAVRMLLMAYSLAKILGGAYGLSNATTRHHSSSILRRLGGNPFVLGAYTIPPYYDSVYGCEMELLRFDSTSPNPRYAGWIQSCHDILIESPVILSASPETDEVSLLQLNVALSGPPDRVAPVTRDLSCLKR
jgi:hypothetical protein